MTEGSAKILVVEDESLIAAHIEENLIALGYRVPGIANSGVQALRLVHETQPDLILMDITLKGDMDGIAVARQVRSTLKIPVVYLTAHADDATLKRARLTEPYGYILKPFSDRELKTTIEMALYKHQMEMKLHESEQWLRTTLRSVADAVIATNGNGHVTFMNPTAESLTGWSTDEAQGKPFDEVFVTHDEHGARQGNPVTRVLASGEIVGRANGAVLHARAGSARHIDDSAAPIRDEKGNVRGVVVVFRDISERRRTQELFQRLIENTTDVITIVEKDGTLRYQSPSAERVLGFTPHEMLGKSAFDIVHPDDADRVKRSFEHLLSHPGDPLQLELRVRHKDGSWRTLEAVVKNLIAHEAVGALVANSRDVTERRSLEAKLAQADRLATVGVLAAGVGHEINNPLSYTLFNMEELASQLPRVAEAIRRYRELLVARVGAEQTRTILSDIWDQYGHGDIEQLAVRAEEAAQGARRIAKIVRDLRTFSRVDADAAEAVHINLVMESAVGMAFTAIRHRAKIVRDYGETPPVLANASRLAQVFLNLLVNAVQALPEENPEGQQIGIRTWAEGAEVCAQVSDSGTGISNEHLSRLFEPFFTTKPVGVGTGLGLSISHGIIASYGGRIEVKSEAGRGSRFTVRLPLPAERRESERARHMVASWAPGARRSQVRVLIIDDDPRVGKTLGRILADCDAKVVASAAEARALLDREPSFDVVFCDLMMPGESGMEFYRWAAERRSELASRFIFTTGGAFTEAARAFVDHVPCTTVEKPFDTATIRSAMELIVGSNTMRPRADAPTEPPPEPPSSSLAARAR